MIHCKAHQYASSKRSPPIRASAPNHCSNVGESEDLTLEGISFAGLRDLIQS